MGEWILPTLSYVLMLGQEEDEFVTSSGSVATQRVKAEKSWAAAIAALEGMLQQTADPRDTEGLAPPQGLVLSGPFPTLGSSELLDRYRSWTFTADNSLATIANFFQLPPCETGESPAQNTSTPLPLLPGDPLAAEQFCIALTPKFSFVMVLGETPEGTPGFWFSFEPEQVERACQILRLRVVMLSPAHVNAWDDLMVQFPTIIPHYKTVTQFSHRLLAHLPCELPCPSGSIGQGISQPQHPEIPDHFAPSAHLAAASLATSSLDVELLQAIAHEVRTPLTTIRTLTRLLMKRKDMVPDALKRLEVIDRECSEQIDRFGLIFRAVELETSNNKGVSLTPTCLTQVFNQSIPRWQKQAQQRGLALEVGLPNTMPHVVSDPSMLDQALTSLIERSARSLPAGSRIQIEVGLAGDQLKLQVETIANESSCPYQPLLKSLGQMLTFQPETGVLSLNLTVTKNLFQALGGKLTVKEKSAHQGEIFTVFLPLQPESIDLGRLDHQPTHLV